MIAATLIDAKLYLIPLSVVWLAAGVAAAGLPGSVALGWVPTEWLGVADRRDGWAQLVPFESGVAPWVAAGAAAGLAVAVGLLRFGVLPLSFAEEVPLPEGADPDDPNLILHHPHPRREIGKELLFLAFPVLGAFGGWAIAPADAEIGGPVGYTAAGVVLGYLVGGGLVWGTRVLGTLGFGKEAMGLGDVHLLAAIGAVIGWRDTVLVFFVAPFFGIVGAILTAGIGALIKQRVRVIPYGPYLCGAAVVVMLWGEAIWAAVFP
ncbi:MAG: A24 family peptidase [Planctomycetota bacterium]